MYHERTKHIDIRYHFIWEKLSEGLASSLVLINPHIYSNMYISTCEGPAQNPKQGGRCNVYFLSIIDDYSMKVWVHLLKSKSETFEKYKN